jgi:hypothetical protein
MALERIAEPDALPGPVFAEFVAAAIGLPIALDALRDEPVPAAAPGSPS